MLVLTFLFLLLARAKLPTPIDPSALLYAKKVLCTLTSDYQAGLPENADLKGDADMCFPVKRSEHRSIDFYRAFAQYRDLLKRHDIVTTYQTPREYKQHYLTYYHIEVSYDNYDDTFCTDSYYASYIFKNLLNCK